jgi:dienelactone hydrolase
MSVELDGFERSTFAHEGSSHDVYRAGTGPAVIVIHEMPGLHPGMVTFGRRLVDAGYSVYLPSLFGKVGRRFSAGAMLPVTLGVCVSREFNVFADRTSRVNSWLLGLARNAHAEAGGPGVGAIGMCFTGNFALAMAIDETVLAPVLSQPALPATSRSGLALDEADLAKVKERTARGLCLLGMRFSDDRGCPPERFARLRQEFGDAFKAIEIDSSPGNPYGISQKAHSVVTEDLVDEPGHPTREALDAMMAFLNDRLKS